jgi:HAD superfamily hydrolase (TIGR01484 family)
MKEGELAAGNLGKYKYFKDHLQEIKEGIKQLKVIYSDLDGTLFNDQGCLIKDAENNYYFEAVRLLEKVKARGWDLVIVSGRNKHTLRYNAQMIGVENYISELGSELIYGLGKEVHVTFDDSDCHDITYGSKDLVRIIDLMMEEFPGKIESRMEWSRYRSYNGLFLGDVDLEKANKVLWDAGYKGLVFLDNGISKLMETSLDIEKMHIINLMPAGVNKANGLAMDKKIRNFTRENCIALGDSPEDLKMAPEVKYFFLMVNALEHKEELNGELKKHDNVYITEKAMNHGWHEVIGSLL